MKKLLLLSLLFTIFVVLLPTNKVIAQHKTAIGTASDDYCDGWELGWKEGWKYVKGEYSYPPYPPYCPFPDFGRDKFKDGYNRGFLAGKKAAEK